MSLEVAASQPVLLSASTLRRWRFQYLNSSDHRVNRCTAPEREHHLGTGMPKVHIRYHGQIRSRELGEHSANLIIKRAPHLRCVAVRPTDEECRELLKNSLRAIISQPRAYPRRRRHQFRGFEHEHSTIPQFGSRPTRCSFERLEHFGAPADQPPFNARIALKPNPALVRFELADTIACNWIAPIRELFGPRLGCLKFERLALEQSASDRAFHKWTNATVFGQVGHETRAVEADHTGA